MNRMGFVIGAVALCANPALGQSFNFDPPTYPGTPAGVDLNPVFATPPALGTDGWYSPVAASAIYKMYTYTGNAPGFAAHPTAGGDGMIAGRSAGAANPARAQHDIVFSQGTWTAAWDMNCLYDGVAPSANNLGSFSLQPSTTARAWQTLYNWVANATPTTWNCAFLPYSATNVQAAQPGVLPDPAFGGLAANTWYRVSVTWSFASNKITLVKITNLATGATTSTNPTDYYLFGGATPTTQTIPTGVRFFAGGALGNHIASDNLSVTSCYADCNGSGSLTIADFGCFQAYFAGGNMYADCNNSTTLTIADFGCFQAAFSGGCPTP